MPRYRALLGLRAAWLARSGYMWAIAPTLARRAGLTDADLRRIAQGPDAPGGPVRGSTLLRSADELHIDSFISDASWKTLSARFDLPQMIDTIDTTAETTMYSGLFNSLGSRLNRGSSIDCRRDSRTRSPRSEPTCASTHAADRAGGGAAGGRGGGANVFRTFNKHPPADRVRGAINTHITGCTR
jgi:hypothetical protein